MLGDINIDTVWPLAELPAPGHDVYVDEIKVGLGGAVLNSAIALDRLGQPTGMLSCLGQDLWAQRAREMLGQTGINLSYIHEMKEIGTGLIFLAVTPDGERTMFSYRGANIYFSPKHLDDEVIKLAGMLHISGYSLLEAPQKDAVWRAVELAEQYDLPISLDTGLEPAILNPDGLRRLMAKVDICVTGLKETGQLFDINDAEEAAGHLLSLGVKLAAIKLGEKGSYLAKGQERFVCPAFKIDVLDTTGAGDSYSAGLLYAWMNGLSLPASGVLASALGALAATVSGAGLALPDRQKVIEFLRDRHTESEGNNRAINEILNNLR